jgi:hypothetical protein
VNERRNQTVPTFTALWSRHRVSAGSAGTHRLANEAATESAIMIAVFGSFQAGSPKSPPHLYATIARNPVYTDFSGESFAAPQTEDSPVHECCTPLRAAI